MTTTQVLELGMAEAEQYPTLKRCGNCTLCCKVVPVAELNKERGRWCDHARPGKGCAIYPTRPHGCKIWRCQWLISPLFEAGDRPDRCGVVFDTMIEGAPAKAVHRKTLELVEFKPAQAFVDADRYDEQPWHKPNIERLIELFGEHGIPVAFRCADKTLRGVCVFHGKAAELLGLDPAVFTEMQLTADVQWQPHQLWEKEALGL